MTSTEAWMAIPQTKREELARYLVHGIRPGATMASFLSGNIFRAAQFADAATLASFGAMARFLESHGPIASFNYPGASDRWAVVDEEIRIRRVRDGAGAAFDLIVQDSGILVDA